ncbi:hypothetical protein D779_0124 [Imhoffiella purpurea]|uniref:Uncharacterized protein n=2 Tax=Imhoffiella purpurea TaxID=1249627 RepID=W9VA83_9GAMM|nr:hypothetical protein D779_0124 [Imhoffiella purpurea]
MNDHRVANPHEYKEIATMNDARIQLTDEERTPCEVWTRVMGYHRPVSAFNTGKRAEHADRCYFNESPKGSVQRREQLAAA